MTIHDDEIEAMRRRDMARAEEQPMPAQFEAERIEGTNIVIIGNKSNGQMTGVDLYNYKRYRTFLNDLFGEE